jgi:hypothetical protein
MGKIVITEFVSLDGVVEDPAGVGDFGHAGCGELSDKKPLRLLHTRTVGDGVVLNNYEPVRRLS